MNSTIINKKKICVACGKKDFWFSKKMCKSCSIVHSTKKRIAKNEESEEDLSLKYLIEDLDIVFSQYIRCKYADKNGIVECYTSGKKMHWTKIQNGHYIPRSSLATRWLEDNCRPQSEHDNCMLNGNMEVFAKNLEQDKPGITDYLLEQSRQITKPTRDELKSLIIEYRDKLKILKTKYEKN